MFLQNERRLGVKNGTLGTIEDVSPQNMTVRTDDGRTVSFDLKDYDRIDHGYAATIHKAQGMTVDRTHVLATPGMDAHGSYVALSRHRDRVDLYYGGDDFASQDKLVSTLSRDRAKDMASDYQQQINPLHDYADRRGIAVNAHVAEIDLSARPDQKRIIFDGRSMSGDSAPADRDEARRPERERAGIEGGHDPNPAEAEREIGSDPEEELRRARTRALIRHARAVDAIFRSDDAGQKASAGEWDELVKARREFDHVRPHGWQDAEAAYAKEGGLAREAGSGRVNRAIRALQLETELRTDPQRRADRFVERWQKLDQTSQRQYQAGDMAGYKATRSQMGDMAKSLERDPQLESILANRKRDLGISFDSGRSLGRELAFHHGLGLGRGRGIGL
jgi:hypothetical protein